MMSSQFSIQRSINHWVHALSLFGTEVNELTVPANTVFELTDEFFDDVDVQPSETEWFQVDAKRHEVFLDDDVSTLRLANRRVLQSLHGDAEHPLVSWFGYKPEHYELVMHADDESVVRPEIETQKLAWVGWDYRVWKTYLFDGGRLIPITQSGAITAGLDVDVNRITWMGWDGENLDVFTSPFPQVPDTMAAVFVARDDSVLAVHKSLR